jgi:hypothetical protein
MYGTHYGGSQLYYFFCHFITLNKKENERPRHVNKLRAA